MWAGNLGFDWKALILFPMYLTIIDYAAFTFGIPFDYSASSFPFHFSLLTVWLRCRPPFLFGSFSQYLHLEPLVYAPAIVNRAPIDLSSTSGRDVEINFSAVCWSQIRQSLHNYSSSRFVLGIASILYSLESTVIQTTPSL